MLFRRTKKEGPVKVLGISHYPACDVLFQDTLKIQWGENLSKDELKRAQREVTKHFKNLYLIEIIATNPLDESDIGKITQRHACLPRDDWQAPYNERKLDEQGLHWAFFFHFLNRKKPLMTPFGEIALPKPSEIPAHLRSITYNAPAF